MLDRIKSELFIRILKSHRKSFNELFALEKYKSFHLDPGIFLEQLVNIIDPFLLQSREKDPVLLGQITVLLYGQILELCSKGFLGAEAKYPHFEEAFTKLFMHFSAYLFSSPLDFTAALGNAIYNLANLAPAQLPFWLEKMLRFNPADLTFSDFKKIGFIAAWTCGLVHYRNRALGYCRELPAAWFTKLLQLDGCTVDEANKNELITRLEKNPWLVPASLLTKSASPISPTILLKSGFSGFGGDFIKPPHVYIRVDRFIATDGEARYYVFADCFGQILRPGDEAVKPEKQRDENKANQISINDKYQISFKDKHFDLPQNMRLPINSTAANSHTLIFTSPYSHMLFIIGLGDVNS